MPKRAANGDGALRQRKDGSWEYRVVVGYDAEQKPIRKSFYGKGKTEPKRKYKEWLQTPSEVRIEKVTTVGEWAVIWLELYKKGSVEYGTYRNYEAYVNNHIVPEIGKLKFEDVKPAHVKRLMKKIEKLSGSAKRHVTISLNGIFETAIENKMCVVNPCGKIKIPKSNTEPQVFTQSEIAAILTAAQDIKDGHIIELLLYTGIRIGEAAGLKWGDVDRPNGIITIRRSVARKDGGGYDEKSTKSGKSREIGINNRLAILLDRIPVNGVYVLARTALDIPNPHSLEKRYTAAMKLMNEHLEKNNLDAVRPLTPHKCRHTYATYLLKGGANLREVQQLLGHSKVNVTEIYTHIDTDDIKSSVTKLPY